MLQREICLLPYQFGNALISDAHFYFGFLRLSLSICHTNNVWDISQLNVTHSPCDGHIHFMNIGTVRWG